LPHAGSEFDAIVLARSSSARDVYEQVAGALDLLRWGGVLLLTDYYRTNRAFPWASGTPQFRALARIQRENPQISVELVPPGIAIVARTGPSG
jgi:hypothetical protein